MVGNVPRDIADGGSFFFAQLSSVPLIHTILDHSSVFNLQLRVTTEALPQAL